MTAKTLPPLSICSCLYFVYIFLGTWLIDRISNSRLHEKCGSIPLSRAIMKEKVEMARPCSAKEGGQIAEDSPFWLTTWGYTESRSSSSGVVGCHK